MTMTTEPSLSPQQEAIVPMAAYAATGDLSRLNVALGQALDAGLSISDCKEILTQLYAYAGFPRSLNALTALMKLLQTRPRMSRAASQAPSPSAKLCWRLAPRIKPSSRARQSPALCSNSHPQSVCI